MATDSSANACTAWTWERGPGRFWTLWFDRPGRSQNTLDASVLDELADRLQWAEEMRDEIGMVVLRSRKAKGFCAGADLHQFLVCQEPEEVKSFLRHGFAAFDRLARFQAPTVAVVHGYCLGGGLELALSCRSIVAVAGDVELKIGTPEVRIGLIPGWGAIGALPRRVGLLPALDLLFGGLPIQDEEAARIGLVDRVAAEPVLFDILNELPTERPAPSSPPPDWREVVERYVTALSRNENEHLMAIAQLLIVLEIELTEGTEAGREAAVVHLAGLAVTDAAKASMASIFRRPA